MAKKVVIDIETIGRDFESFDEMSKEYLLKFTETDEEVKEAKESLAFYPHTGEIAAIGMLEQDAEKGAVYYQAPGTTLFPDMPVEQTGSLKAGAQALRKGGIEFTADTEAGILRKFWEAVKNYDQIITFNGRAFDAPFIIIRSAIHKIKPTKDLMPNRYSGTAHIDLLDQLTFFGSVRKRFSLHMWCMAFGIKSPKDEGVTGHEVSGLFKSGRYLDIAKYCLGDLYATRELYNYWEKYVK